jgi:hypothetical protein
MCLILAGTTQRMQMSEVARLFVEAGSANIDADRGYSDAADSVRKAQLPELPVRLNQHTRPTIYRV